MFSKNNRFAMERKLSASKQRFGLRKIMGGVASVLLGLTFLYGSQASADELTSSAPAAVSSQLVTNGSTGAGDVPPAPGAVESTTGATTVDSAQQAVTGTLEAGTSQPITAAPTQATAGINAEGQPENPALVNPTAQVEKADPYREVCVTIIFNDTESTWRDYVHFHSDYHLAFSGEDLNRDYLHQLGLEVVDPQAWYHFHSFEGGIIDLEISVRHRREQRTENKDVEQVIWGVDDQGNRHQLHSQKQTVTLRYELNLRTGEKVYLTALPKFDDHYVTAPAGYQAADPFVAGTIIDLDTPALVEKTVNLTPVFTAQPDQPGSSDQGSDDQPTGSDTDSQPGAGTTAGNTGSTAGGQQSQPAPVLTAVTSTGGKQAAVASATSGANQEQQATLPATGTADNPAATVTGAVILGLMAQLLTFGLLRRKKVNK